MVWPGGEPGQGRGAQRTSNWTIDCRGALVPGVGVCATTTSSFDPAIVLTVGSSPTLVRTSSAQSLGSPVTSGTCPGASAGTWGNGGDPRTSQPEGEPSSCTHRKGHSYQPDHQSSFHPVASWITPSMGVGSATMSCASFFVHQPLVLLEYAKRGLRSINQPLIEPLITCPFRKGNNKEVPSIWGLRVVSEHP